MRAKPKFTLVTDPEKINRGDILIIPHEREVKRKRLHFTSPKSLVKLGARVGKCNFKDVMDVFTDVDHTRAVMVTSIVYKYVRESVILASLTNSISGSDYVRPINSIHLSALSSQSAISTFDDIIKENLKEAKASIDYLINAVVTMDECNTEPNAVPRVYGSSMENNAKIFEDITGYLTDNCKFVEGFSVTTPFVKTMLARGVKIIRPANRAAKEAFPMNFLKEQHLNKMLTSIDTSIADSMRLIEGLRKNISQVRKMRTWWKKFFTNGASQKTSAFEAAARISGTKKEDVLWK
jgi:hypothetical protein